MKCETCSKEIKINNTVIDKVLSIEVETVTHDKGKKLSDIIIPSGWRLLRFDEFVSLLNRKIIDIDSLDDDFFIEQPFKENKNKGLVAIVIRNWSSELNLCLDGEPSYAIPFLGVRFCKDLKKVSS